MHNYFVYANHAEYFFFFLFSYIEYKKYSLEEFHHKKTIWIVSIIYIIRNKLEGLPKLKPMYTKTW